MRAARLISRLLDSPATYPLLTMWLIGGATFAIRLAGHLDGVQVFAIMTAALVLLMLAAFRLELRKVHSLVNHTSARQVNRITQLTKALEKSGVVVPAEPELSEELTDDTT